MKNIIRCLPLIVAALGIAGCGKTDTAQPGSEVSPGATPSSSSPSLSSAATAAVATAKETVTTAATDFASKLVASAKQKGDSVLAGVSQDLGGSVKTLGESLASNPTVKSYLDSTVQALTNRKDLDAMQAYQKLTASKLTPEQTKLAGDVKNLVSAYVTQNNFSGVPGAEGEVSQIVSLLRKGEVTSVLPHLQKVAQMATLTPAQKDLVGGLVDSYAPTLKDAGQKALDSLKSLQK